MTDVNLITVNEFGQYAPEVDTSKYDAATISGMISQASKMVSDYLGYTPVLEDIVNEVKEAMITSEGDLLIYPQKIPVVTVSALAIMKGATSVSINLTDGAGNNKYNIDYTATKIRYPYGEITLQGVPIFTDFYSLRSTQFYVKMSYSAGFALGALPYDIKLATILYMRDILSRSMNTSGAVEISQGGIRLKYAERDGKSDLVQDAERMLRSYRRIG